VPVPEVVNVCVPVVVNHGVPVGACVRVLQQEVGQINTGHLCMLCTDRPCCLCNGYQPDRCLVVVCVGWLALRLSACEFGPAVAGLHFVMLRLWGNQRIGK
jgi:hypothetical protein